MFQFIRDMLCWGVKVSILYKVLDPHELDGANLELTLEVARVAASKDNN